MQYFTAILAMASAATAHMIMKTPTPFNAPNNSPLDAAGADFPCKITGSADVTSGPVNQMSVGSANTLSFTGSAVHGGGSCQVSLARTTTPDKNTKWMVIHSIEGGCPADVAGNLPADPNGDGAATFQFTVPDHPDLPADDYTLAWTWNNKIGNREMYMNCAYVKLSAATKKRYAPAPPVSKRQQAPLPDMFVANIGNGCTCPENGDCKYPNPGSSLEVGKDATLIDPTGNCGASSDSSSGSGSSAAASSAVASSTTAATAAGNTVAPTQPTTTAASQITQSSGGVFATVAASSAAATQAASSPTASAAAPATPATSASVPLGTGTSSSSTSGSCNVGDWDCAADGASFTRCVSGGTWSASIPMSAGLTCVPGISSTFAYNVSGTPGKRDIRSHISRRRHNLHDMSI